MSSLGQTLRQAREAKGLSQSQVASQTRILVQIINDIENEDFHRIAAPIYGRGFVRLFAECVDLEPQPLIREFMDIYEGRRAPTVMVREIPTEAPPAVPEPAASASMPSQSSIPDPFPAPAPEPSPFVAKPVIDETLPPPEPEPIVPETTPGLEPTPELTPVLEPAPEPEPAPAPVLEPEPTPVLETPPIVTPAPQASQPLSAESATIPEPIPDSEPVYPEPPPVVRGLDLFDQAMVPQSSLSAAPAPEEVSSNEPSSQMDISDSPFLPPTYEDHGPSAAERFKNGISSVSHGVLRSVQRIPRSAWRKSVLVCGAVAVIAVMVFGCLQLYKMTTPASPSCEGDVCEYTPRTQPTKPEAASSTSQKPRQQSASTKTVAAKPTSAKPTPAQANPQAAKLRSTGQKVPPLYVD